MPSWIGAVLAYQQQISRALIVRFPQRSGRVAERLGMKLVHQVSVPANATRGEVVAQHYQIDRGVWLSGSARHEARSYFLPIGTLA